MIVILLIKKQKFITKQKRKNTKTSRGYYRNPSEDENIKNRNYVNNRNKNMSNADREKRK